MPLHSQSEPVRVGFRAVPKEVRPGRKLFSDSAYRLIKQRIMSNAYPGGYQILEEDLARDLGISRTPLKEALLALQSEGLVRLIPRRGVLVIPLTADDISEIYRVLEALEDLAVALICERDDNKDDIDALQADVTAMQAALRADDLDAWAVADESFHATLVAASGNARLAHAARTLLCQSQRFRLFTLRLRNKHANSTRNHAALVKALRDGDAARARRLHAQQKVGWREQMMALLEKFKISQI
jgi:DNA-binding GntR family transcriptional regulator